MKLTTKQAAHLKRVKTTNTEWRIAKADSAARARLIAEQEVEAFRNAMDHEVRAAFEAGVPKSQIRAFGLGTTNIAALVESLERTAPAAAALADKLVTDPLAHRYSMAEPNILTVTLAGRELAEAVRDAEWSGEMPSTADFQVLERDDGSPYLKAITKAHDALFNAHPIVAWGRAHGTEALAWLAAREVAA